MKSGSQLIAILGIAAFIATLPAHAAEVFFDFDADPDQAWETATNWVGDAQPAGGDRARINGNFTVEVTTNVGTINALQIGLNGNSSNGDGTLTIDGGSLTISDTGGTSADVVLGAFNRTGTIIIRNGGNLTADNAGSDGQIFLATNGTGTGIISIEDGTIIAERGLFIGGDNTNLDRANTTGTVTLGDGTGAAGTATITTSGGNTEAGYGGTGTLTINSDGVLNQNSSNLVIGQGAASNGSVIVDGGTINIANGDINMNSGTSAFTINSGTVTISDDLNLSAATNGNTGTVNFNGGVLTMDDMLERDGTNTVNYNGTQITAAGGDFDADNFSIGTSGGSAVTMNVVAAASAAGDVQLNLAEWGSLTLGSTVDATLNVDNGVVRVARGIADGGNTATINVGSSATGDFTIGGASGFATSRIDAFNVGANGTLTAAYTAFGINTILTNNADLTGGTFTDSDIFFPQVNTNNSSASQSAWIGGAGEWDASAGNWSNGLPAGTTITSGTSFEVLNSSNAIIGSLTDATTANWNLSQTTNSISISAASDITSGPVRAYIAGGNVSRLSDLRIARDFGADANYLQVVAGASLTVGTPSTNAKLIIGANSGAGDNNGTVLQNGGTVTVNGDLQFGVDGLAGDLGGTYDMRGGTLNVTGDVRELTATTNSAQFLINGNSQANIDGNILVQRFALADSNVSNQTATYIITGGQTVTSTGTTAVGNGANARGTLTLDDATSSLTAANMAVGGGNNSRGTFTVNEGTATITQGGNSNRFLLGSGTVTSTGISTFNLNGGTFQMTSTDSDFLVRSGTVTLNVSGGTLNLNGAGSSDFLFKRGGGTTDAGVATANFSGGSFIVGRHFDFGNGSAILNLSGDHDFTVGSDVLMTDTGVGNEFNVIGSEVSIDVGNNFNVGTGQTVSFVADAAGISTVQATGGSGTVTLGGNLNLDVSAMTTPTAGDVVDSETTWTAGSGIWSGSNAEWEINDGRMVNPDGSGVLRTNDRLTGFQLAAGSVFAGSPTLSLPTDWAFDNTTDPLKGDFVYTGADVNGLPLHAILDDAAAGSPITINRTTSLQIAPVTGAGASRLTINDGVTLNVSDGTPDGSGPDLILGSATQFGEVFQNGGDVVVDGILGFGDGASSFGGTYNLDGGTLTVFGDIVEGGTGGPDAGVDNAQLYIDGGTLDARGDITTQSFRLGDTAGTTGAYIQNDAGQTLRNTGTFYVAESGTGTYTLQNGVMNVGSTEVGNGVTGVGNWNIQGGQVTAGTTIIGRSGDGNVSITGVASGVSHTFGAVTLGQNNNDTSDGSLTINLANPTDTVNTGRLIVGNGGKGALVFTEGTLNVTGGLDVAETGNASAANGRTATVVIGDGISAPTLNVSGGNFETANSGTGVVTMRSGTYNQTNNNLIVGQGNGSNATFNVEGGTLNISDGAGSAGLIRIGNNNGAVGLFNVTGGSVTADTIDFGANGNGSTGTYQQSDGTVTSSIDFNVNRGVNNINMTGGTLNVTRNMQLHNSATDGQSDIEIGGTSDLNVMGNLDYRGGQTDLKVSGSADVDVTGNLLFDGGGSGTTPSTLTLAGNTAALDVGGDMTITGTNQRFLILEALAAATLPVSTINVGGQLSVGGTLDLRGWDTLFTSAYDVVGGVGNSITLIDYDTFGGGTFIDANDSAAWNEGDYWSHTYSDGTTFQLFYQENATMSGSAVVLRAVPEPSTFLLLALGLSALFLLRRRMLKRTAEAADICPEPGS